MIVTDRNPNGTTNFCVLFLYENTCMFDRASRCDGRSLERGSAADEHAVRAASDTRAPKALFQAETTTETSSSKAFLSRQFIESYVMSLARPR